MNVRNVLTTTALIGLLTLSANGVAANDGKVVDENKERIINIETETINDTNDYIVVEELVESVVAENVDVDKDSLLIPGDFFYFIKQLFEKVQLALTFDDEKTADLLLQFANERILEAEVLIRNGEFDEAESMIQKALNNHLLAIEFVEVIKDDNVQGEDEEASDQNTEYDFDGEKESSNDEVTKDLNNEVEEGQSSFEVRLSQNILSLIKVYNKIENPRAKEAIMRNIVRHYEKLNGVELTAAQREQFFGEVDNNDVQEGTEDLNEIENVAGKTDVDQDIHVEVEADVNEEADKDTTTSIAPVKQNNGKKQVEKKVSENKQKAQENKQKAQDNKYKAQEKKQKAHEKKRENQGNSKKAEQVKKTNNAPEHANQNRENRGQNKENRQQGNPNRGN